MGHSEYRTFVVLNPHSSNGRTGKRWPEIEEAIRRCIGPFDWKATNRPREATDLTREALTKGYEMIVSIGGDGTHHETVNGFFDGKTPIQEKAVLATVTSGTGGDFRRTFGIGTGPYPALDALPGTATRDIDVGWFSYVDNQGVPQEAIFLNILSFGIAGLVDDMVNKTTKVLGGKASFILGTLRAAAKYRAQTVEVRMDDGAWEEKVIHNIAVANGRYFGGGMHVAPLAEPDDGLFDLVGFEGMTTPRFMGLAGSIYKGAHLGKVGVTHHRLKTLEARSNADVLLDVDGEQLGRLPLRIEILHKPIRLKIQEQ